jgi:hypothetical protein
MSTCGRSGQSAGVSEYTVELARQGADRRRLSRPTRIPFSPTRARQAGRTSRLSQKFPQESNRELTSKLSPSPGASLESRPRSSLRNRLCDTPIPSELASASSPVRAAQRSPELHAALDSEPDAERRTETEPLRASSFGKSFHEPIHDSSPDSFREQFHHRIHN